MSTTYPASKQTFTDPNGTSLLTSPDHAGLHTDMNDTVEAIQDTIGTNSGTNILKNFVAGNFPVRINSSNVLQQVISGTVNTTIGTLSGAVIGTPAISAGTWSNPQLIGTAQITGGSVSNAVVGTPAVSAGTWSNAQLIGTPQITGGTIASAGLIGTSQITGGTISGAYFGTTNTYKSSAGTDIFAMDFTSNTGIVVANNGSANPFGGADNFGGLVFVQNYTNGGFAMFASGGGAVTEVADSAGVFSTTADLGTSSNFFRAGDSKLYLQNKTGASGTYTVFGFRTRTQS